MSTQFGRVIPKSFSNWTHVASVFCLWILNAWHFNWDIFLWNEIISNIRLIKTSVSFSSFHHGLLVGFPDLVSRAVERDPPPSVCKREWRRKQAISGPLALPFSTFCASLDSTWLEGSYLSTSEGFNCLPFFSWFIVNFFSFENFNGSRKFSPQVKFCEAAETLQLLPLPDRSKAVGDLDLGDIYV